MSISLRSSVIFKPSLRNFWYNANVVLRFSHLLFYEGSAAVGPHPKIKNGMPKRILH